jgi:hypothetical protein
VKLIAAGIAAFVIGLWGGAGYTARTTSIAPQRHHDAHTWTPAAPYFNPTVGTPRYRGTYGGRP